MQGIRFMLMPLSWIYGAGVRLRNLFYDRKWRPSVRFETNVIVVGNLEAGGTGKSPMISYLVSVLGEQKNLAILSRGYKRKAKGFILAGPGDDASTLGDEPYMFYRKFSPEVTVAVGVSRETAIPFILAERPETDVILMDDGYQYRTVKPSLSVLLTRYDRLFTRDYLLPTGRLRENRIGAARADVIVVTKCPELNQSEMESIRDEIRDYSSAEVFFSGIKYGNPEEIFPGEIGEEIILVSGIAHPQPLYNYLKSNYHIKDHIRFPDHHHYSDSDFKKIYQSGLPVITTEKDAVKWTSENPGVPTYYIPIEAEIIKGGTQFADLLRSSVKEYEKPY